MDSYEIGAAIKAARKKQKITQAELAKLAGLSRETLIRLEKGTIHDLGFRKLIRLLEALSLELHVRPAGYLPVLGDALEDGHA